MEGKGGANLIHFSVDMIQGNVFREYLYNVKGVIIICFTLLYFKLGL